MYPLHAAEHTLWTLLVFSARVIPTWINGLLGQVLVSGKDGLIRHGVFSPCGRETEQTGKVGSSPCILTATSEKAFPASPC